MHNNPLQQQPPFCCVLLPMAMFYCTIHCCWHCFTPPSGCTSSHRLYKSFRSFFKAHILMCPLLKENPFFCHIDVFSSQLNVSPYTTNMTSLHKEIWGPCKKRFPFLPQKKQHPLSHNCGICLNGFCFKVGWMCRLPFLFFSCPWGCFGGVGGKLLELGEKKWQLYLEVT